MTAYFWLTMAVVIAVVCAVAMCGAWQRLVRRIDTVDLHMEFLCDRIERIERKLPK